MAKIDETLELLEKKRLAYKTNLKKGYIFLIFLIGIYFLIRAYSIKDEIICIYKDKVIGYVIKKDYPDYTYNRHKKLNNSQLFESKIINPNLGAYHFSMPRYKITGEDYVSGTLDGVNFECSDIVYKVLTSRTDKNGNTHYSYTTRVKGRWFIFDFNKKTSSNHLLVKEAAFAMEPGFKRYKTESVKFNKKFKTLSTDQHFVFYILTPLLMIRLLDFEKRHPGKLYIAVFDNKVHIAINSFKSYMEPNLNVPFCKENLSVRKDFDEIKEIIHQLKLDCDLYRSQNK